MTDQNKIPTDEEIVQRGLLRRGGHLYFENLIWIAEQARAAGRAEQKQEEAITDEMKTSLFPNSIKASHTFGYGIIASQEEFLEEFRRYILDAVERGRAEGREEQREKDAKLLEERANTLKANHDFFREAVELERQAHNIREQGEGEKP